MRNIFLTPVTNGHVHIFIVTIFLKGCLQDEVLCWADIIMEQYIKIMNEDDDKDTVSQVCTCTADILKLVKYDSIQQCKYFL